MALQREVAKIARNQGKLAVIPWYQTPREVNPFRQWYQENIYPTWFRWFKGPYERWMYETRIQWLRTHGIMEDDTVCERDGMIERALELIPEDIKIMRYRRMMRGAELSFRHGHLPIEHQNYDPMIPYMAPYIEEAKFQIQEEQELMQYHPWDRRLFSGGVSGFGETNISSTFMTW